MIRVQVGRNECSPWWEISSQTWGGGGRSEGALLDFAVPPGLQFDKGRAGDLKPAPATSNNGKLIVVHQSAKLYLTR